MTDLIIHCGAHKTATKSIQSVLGNLKPKLAKENIHYILPTEINDLGIIKALHSKTRNIEEKNKLAKFFKLIIKANKPNTVLISHESFFSFANISPTRHNFYGTMQRSIENFFHYKMDKFFDKVKIIFYIRRQDSFLVSLYLQHLSTGDWVQSFDDTIEKIDYKIISWLKLAKQFEEHFGIQNTIIRPFEKIKEGSDVFLRDFFYNSNINYEFLPEFTRANESFSNPAYLIALRMYPHLDNSKRKLLSSILQKIIPANQYGKAELMSKELTTQILNYHADDNVQVFERYIKDYPRDFYSRMQ